MMNKEQAFNLILQIRDKFIGTKQEQIVIDQAIHTLDLELFPKLKRKPEVKPVEDSKSK